MKRRSAFAVVFARGLIGAPMCALAPLLMVAGCRSAPPELVKPREQPAAAVQTAPRESFEPREARLVAAETLIRSYTAIFGDLMIPEHRKGYDVSNRNARYFGWQEHLSALGLPDYLQDLPRVTQTNTVMVAEFERLAATLCDRAANKDLRPGANKPLTPELKALVQVEAPPVFAFQAKPGPITLDEFRPRFDVLHRTFLGYPAELAPPERTPEFHALYTQVEARHRKEGKGAPPFVSAWSAVCQGLSRHPEFHHY